MSVPPRRLSILPLSNSPWMCPGVEAVESSEPRAPSLAKNYQPWLTILPANPSHSSSLTTSHPSHGVCASPTQESTQQCLLPSKTVVVSRERGSSLAMHYYFASPSKDCSICVARTPAYLATQSCTQIKHTPATKLADTAGSHKQFKNTP